MDKGENEVADAETAKTAAENAYHATNVTNLFPDPRFSIDDLPYVVDDNEWDLDESVGKYNNRSL